MAALTQVRGCWHIPFWGSQRGFWALQEGYASRGSGYSVSMCLGPRTLAAACSSCCAKWLCKLWCDPGLAAGPLRPTGDVPGLQRRTARLPAQGRQVAHLAVEQRPERHPGRPGAPAAPAVVGASAVPAVVGAPAVPAVVAVPCEMSAASSTRREKQVPPAQAMCQECVHPDRLLLRFRPYCLCRWAWARRCRPSASCATCATRATSTGHTWCACSTAGSSLSAWLCLRATAPCGHCIVPGCRVVVHVFQLLLPPTLPCVPVQLPCTPTMLFCAGAGPAVHADQLGQRV